MLLFEDRQVKLITSLVAGEVTLYITTVKDQKFEDSNTFHGVKGLFAYYRGDTRMIIKIKSSNFRLRAPK